MKIACIGNMNNSLFSLTRYLRDRGFDAELLTLQGEPEHFSPESDSFNDQYKSYTRELSWSKRPSVLYHTNPSEILEQITRYDFFIASDVAIAYLQKAGIKSDIFIPYGSDIHTIPHMNIFSAPLKKIHKYHHLKRNQRLGIRNARTISIEITNPLFHKKFIKPLGLRNSFLDVTCPFIYYPQYENGEMDDYKKQALMYRKFLRIREKSDLMIFHHSRHEWNDDGSLEVSEHVWSKGNDKLIKGFKMFTDNNKDTKASLVLFEYGTQVKRSKDLIRKLGIENLVHWFPISPRKDIMSGISLADLGVGELGISWYTYGTILEFMALNVPVAHFRNDELYADKEQMYPMINTNSVEQVFEGIQKISIQDQNIKDIGPKAKCWFKKYAIDAPLEKYMGIIKKSEIQKSYTAF